MAFVETPRFPIRIGFGAVGGPRFLTDIVELDSGAESRNQNWSQSRGEWSIDLMNRTSAERDEIIAYFYSIGKGRLNGFRFKDFNDYQATISQGVFQVVSGATFQMYKRYTQGANTFDRIIQKPVSVSQVKQGSTILTVGVDYTFDSTTGRITTLGGSPTVIPTAWAGEFDVPVRFDSDYLGMRSVGRDSADAILAHAPGLKLVEIRIA